MGTLDLGWETVHDVKCALPRYYPLPFRVMVGSTILALGIVVVVMDLARWYPLRAWWAGELARRGKKVQHQLTPRRLLQIRRAAALKRVQAQRRERGHDLAH